MLAKTRKGPKKMLAALRNIPNAPRKRTMKEQLLNFLDHIYQNDVQKEWCTDHFKYMWWHKLVHAPPTYWMFEKYKVDSKITGNRTFTSCISMNVEGGDYNIYVDVEKKKGSGRFIFQKITKVPKGQSYNPKYSPRIRKTRCKKIKYK